jgi:hypothetical protein
MHLPFRLRGGLISAGRRFIGGVPTNPATKRFAGRS